jgi:NADH-quinone oxidoreductase subunit C/D
MNAPNRFVMPSPLDELRAAFPDATLVPQVTADGIPTIWVARTEIVAVARFLRLHALRTYPMLLDLHGVDERMRVHRPVGTPISDFTLIVHLTSPFHSHDVRLKVALAGEPPTAPTLSGVYPNADWYEREAFDMLGFHFEGHPGLRRILMPPTWPGHPLRKDHPARATEAGPFRLTMEKREQEMAALAFDPADWGMKRERERSDFMFLNLGPQHPGTHGLLRFVLQLDGEEIVRAIPDIGYHHRGAEKMGERQSWHSYIPYTDRVDYFSGVMNNLGYLMSLETLAGIQVPARAATIRVMMSELFRLCSHLVWLGTFAQDIGALSPVFYMFTDREKAFDIVEAVTGGRMHPAWFRLGGTAADLPNGWERLFREFLDWLPPRLDEYEKLVMGSAILKARTVGIGEFNLEEALDWGVTGAGLRALGVDWDLRKARPYSGYENFTFDVPTANRGDAWTRSWVRFQEMRESLKIIEQCVANMPAGPYKADHPLTTPPAKERTMHDIETLIHHFLGVSWGPVIPAGEACIPIEASKGVTGWALTSDGSTTSYRTRIRTPSFAHMQMIPLLTAGGTIADLMAILAAMDFILADLDR